MLLGFRQDLEFATLPEDQLEPPLQCLVQPPDESPQLIVRKVDDIGRRQTVGISTLDTQTDPVREAGRIPLDDRCEPLEQQPGIHLGLLELGLVDDRSGSLAERCEGVDQEGLRPGAGNRPAGQSLDLLEDGVVDDNYLGRSTTTILAG